MIGRKILPKWRKWSLFLLPSKNQIWTFFQRKYYNCLLCPYCEANYFPLSFVHINVFLFLSQLTYIWEKEMPYLRNLWINNSLPWFPISQQSWYTHATGSVHRKSTRKYEKEKQSRSPLYLLHLGLISESCKCQKSREEDGMRWTTRERLL